MSEGLALFPTAIGRCGIAWSGRGIARVALPEANDAVLAARLGACTPGEPPPSVARVVARLQRHLEGEPDPLADVELDWSGLSAFAARVYRAARGVPPGRTTSYADLAALAGAPGAARAVGGAMARNPLPLLVPCHRVLAADGSLGGFSARGALATKLRLLTVEGADLRALAQAGVRQLRRDDERLGAVIDRVGPLALHFQQRGDRLSALAEAIVHQQVSMKAGASIFAKLRAAVGAGADGVIDPARLLARRDSTLRAAGLSRQKLGYLRDLARRAARGTLPLAAMDRMDDARVIEQLTQVRGIGLWSAQMFLIFRLGRLDVLPSGDLGLRKGVQQLLGLRKLPSPRAVEEHAAAWAPFRSIASWYLWRSLEAGGL